MAVLALLLAVVVIFIVGTGLLLGAHWFSMQVAKFLESLLDKAAQRAMVATRIATLTHGGDRVSEQAANLPVATQSEAAELLNIVQAAGYLTARQRPRGENQLVKFTNCGDAAPASSTW